MRARFETSGEHLIAHDESLPTAGRWRAGASGTRSSEGAVRSSNAGRAQTGDRATDAATMTMLNLGIEAWQENRTEERKAFRRMQVTAGGWWGHKRAEAQHDLVLAGLRASRVLLRETVRLMGAHLRRAGLRPEDLVPALHDVLQRASSKAHVADGPDLVELVRDAVTWGIEGYYAIGNR